MINVTITGDNVVLSNLKGLEKTVSVKVNQAITVSSAKVLAESRRTAPKVFGNLVRSSRILIRKDEQLVEYNAGYAYYAEMGRKPGKWPPIQPILDWVHKRGLGGTYSIKTKKRAGNYDSQIKQDRGIAFVIARSIGKKGTRPHPYLGPAFEKEKPFFIQRLREI